MNLHSMLSGNWFDELATAIPAISAIDEGKTAPRVATVARIAVANPSDQKAENEIEQAGSALDLALPGPADTTSDTFTARLTLFKDRGLSTEEAEELAHRLTGRDLEQDDRRLCIECSHASGGAGGWRCSQWRPMQINSPDLPGDLVKVILHRCVRFNERLEAIN